MLNYRDLRAYKQMSIGKGNTLWNFVYTQG